VSCEPATVFTSILLLSSHLYINQLGGF
jgi:hypothetical protein